MSQANQVREIVRIADRLGQAFASAHAQTIPPVLALQQAYHQAQSQSQVLSEDLAESYLSVVRDGLMLMEGAVNEMIALVFQIDIFKAGPDADEDAPAFLRGNFDPKEALDTVSDLFHMYQAELFSKRESLADLTCEDIDVDTFATRWQRLDEVEQGKKQEMDDLADLLAGLG
ncbi:hypothetical protein V8E36_003193 [Tilletia maclaganii]